MYSQLSGCTNMNQIHNTDFFLHAFHLNLVIKLSTLSIMDFQIIYNIYNIYMYIYVYIYIYIFYICYIIFESPWSTKYTYSKIEIIKVLAKTHWTNDTQTIKDHSTSSDIKTIQNYPWKTGMQKQETPT